MSKSCVTEYELNCVICGRPTTTTHHLIEGNGKRPLSDKYGLLVPLCDAHHNMSNNSVHLNPAMQAMGHIIGQLAFEKDFYRKGAEDPAREEFRRIFGKSYL